MRASILIFATNLQALVITDKEAAEIGKFCESLELAHALVVDADKEGQSLWVRGRQVAETLKQHEIF